MRAILMRLPAVWGDRLKEIDLERAREIRIRVGCVTQVRFAKGAQTAGDDVTQAEMTELVGALTGHSVYAYEAQMREGFFTLPGGFRVGLTGRYGGEADAPIQTVTSLCIRISRHVQGKAAFLLPYLMDARRMRSTLILSAPCMGKTTLLRALIEMVSKAGHTVAVADERDELAGGTPLGPYTDVCALSPKHMAIARMIRALSPDVVATDELGGEGDAEAIAEAARCGVCVLATAHAAGMESARQRKALEGIVSSGVFERVVELGREAGHVVRILTGEGEALWTDGLSD